MKNKLKYLKKINPTALLMIGFLLGLAVMYLFLQPKLTYQGKSVVDWAIVANQNNKDVSSYKEQFASVSAQLQSLLNAPSPTPKVEYINKVPSGKNLSNCTKEDKFYFCPDDNCYYNPNGQPTGTCYVAPPSDFKY